MAAQISNLSTTIANTKLLIALLDVIEEFRDLSIEEWNFREILQTYLRTLLHRQKIYWKQRCNIKWVKFGDITTKFFHARAFISHKINAITCLQDNNGNMVFDHDKKANILWEAYKERLGKTEYSVMHFDLSTLLHAEDNLEGLHDPFTEEEIDKVVADMPSNKSPGPDGFSGDFLKKCWPIIVQDFYALCTLFYEGGIYTQSINGSYVTLVPKKDAPTLVGDFRPISLLNSSIKLITKLLANKLQSVILWLVHTNQYGLSNQE